MKWNFVRQIRSASRTRLGVLRPPSSPFSLSSTEFVEPPEQNSWVRHCYIATRRYINASTNLPWHHTQYKYPSALAGSFYSPLDLSTNQSPATTVPVRSHNRGSFALRWCINVGHRLPADQAGRKPYWRRQDIPWGRDQADILLRNVSAPSAKHLPLAQKSTRILILFLLTMYDYQSTHARACAHTHTHTHNLPPHRKPRHLTKQPNH